MKRSPKSGHAGSLPAVPLAETPRPGPRPDTLLLDELTNAITVIVCHRDLARLRPDSDHRTRYHAALRAFAIRLLSEANDDEEAMVLDRFAPPAPPVPDPGTAAKKT